MEFDIIRYVLIFLTYFGHNSGTKEGLCIVVCRVRYISDT
jgi:fucose 4-O-acetylase-like acetyltransferase